MRDWERAVAVLPTEMQRILHEIPTTVKNEAQEIRLRKDQGILLTSPSGNYPITDFQCTAKKLYDIFIHLCNDSVYSHQQEIQNGYISVKNGCRAGIAGRAVMENGQVVSVQDITSICFRIAREHTGCAKELAFTLNREDRLHSALICGGPASGKTSLLRDLIRLLSTGKRGRQLAVVDERGELMLTKSPCEVLLSYPKAQGIEQALRTLSPEGIVFDEFGDEAEARAVLHCLNSGIAPICSVHAEGAETLRRRPVVQKVLQSGAFDYVVILAGRRSPGKISQILPAEEVL